MTNTNMSGLKHVQLQKIQNERIFTSDANNGLIMCNNSRHEMNSDNNNCVNDRKITDFSIDKILEDNKRNTERNNKIGVSSGDDILDLSKNSDQNYLLKHCTTNDYKQKGYHDNDSIILNQQSKQSDIIVKPKVIKYWNSNINLQNSINKPTFNFDNQLFSDSNSISCGFYYKSFNTTTNLINQNYYYHYYHQNHLRQQQQEQQNFLLKSSTQINPLIVPTIWPLPPTNRCNGTELPISVSRHTKNIRSINKLQEIGDCQETVPNDFGNSNTDDKKKLEKLIRPKIVDEQLYVGYERNLITVPATDDEHCFRCHICDKVFGSSDTLQIHIKTHKSPRYECIDCGKGFSQLRNYKYHISVHRGTKEFAAECPECGKVFNDKGYLSSHMKIHRNKKEYECPYCPKSFNQRVAFNMHVRIHTGVKPHKCVECGKRFSRKMLLKQHMRTHSGEKPYTCSVCGKSFADRSNMTLHHRLHSGIKPFTCPICPKAFTKKHHLKTHLNYHTGCKPYICPHPNCNQAFTQSSNMRTHAKKCQFKQSDKQNGDINGNKIHNGGITFLQLQPEINNNIHMSHEAILV